MDQKLVIPVHEGLEWQEFKSYLEGFAAGAQAAAHAAIEARTAQLSRRAQAPPALAPPAAPELPKEE